jgi:DNA invertase Pin-like site-specific DNA recombinase
MKLAEYRRVSTKTQVKDGYGLSIQGKDDRAWAAANGHTIVATYTDAGMKGALPAEERQGLQDALRDIRDGKADGLLCGKLDRLARALTTQEAILAVVWRPRAGGRPAGRVFTADIGEILPDDPDDPMRTAMRQMAGVFAQLDRALAVKRMRDGRAAKAATGRHAVGTYRFGLTGGGEGKSRDAVAVDSEQRIVARIVALRAEGLSYRRVIAVLEAEGCAPRTAERWSPSTVRTIALRAAASRP